MDRRYECQVWTAAVPSQPERPRQSCRSQHLKSLHYRQRTRQSGWRSDHCQDVLGHSGVVLLDCDRHWRRRHLSPDLLPRLHQESIRAEAIGEKRATVGPAEGGEGLDRLRRNSRYRQEEPGGRDGDHHVGSAKGGLSGGGHEDGSRCRA